MMASSQKMGNFHFLHLNLKCFNQKHVLIRNPGHVLNQNTILNQMLEMKISQFFESLPAIKEKKRSSGHFPFKKVIK